MVTAARVLLGIAAVGAAAAAGPAFGDAANAEGALRAALFWQAYGLLVFAGLFALLARRPHGYRGVWELVIFHKVALTATALVIGDALVVAADGALSVLLVTAYVLGRGWARPAR